VAEQNLAEGVSPNMVLCSPKCPNRAFCSYRLLYAVRPYSISYCTIFYLFYFQFY